MKRVCVCSSDRGCGVGVVLVRWSRWVMEMSPGPERGSSTTVSRSGPPKPADEGVDADEEENWVSESQRTANATIVSFVFVII